MAHAPRFALSVLGLLAAGSVLVASNDAEACGGCFHPEDQGETTVISAHRMALSISPAQTVLWDQVQYSGSPSEFAWVLPIKPGARLEVGTSAWFEALDAATSTRVSGPPLNCAGAYYGDDVSSDGCSAPFGCGMSASDDATLAANERAGGELEAPPPVTVVHEGTVGPYETVTVHANDPGALTGWLQQHGYAIDADIQPIIDAYTSEGFDFIALRLAPNQGVQQMQPVRVVSPGAVPTLPLRMVSAGTGANVAITLFVIGEGRWETKSFPAALVDESGLSWDFNASQSNYSSLRAAALAQNGFRTWLTTYSKQGTLLSQVTDPAAAATGFGAPVTYQVGQSGSGVAATTIGEAYVREAVANGEIDGSFLSSCVGVLAGLATSSEAVVDTCTHPVGGGDTGGGGAGGGGGSAGGGAAGGGSICGDPQPGEIAASQIACGDADDLAVAMTGMHPKDVWVTRLEANLPHDALKEDLVIQASVTQAPVENLVTAPKATNAPCDLLAPATGSGATPAGLVPPQDLAGRLEAKRSARERRDLAMMAVTLAALGLAMARRLARTRGLAARPVRNEA